MFTILKAPVDSLAVKGVTDSVKTALLDTAGKSDIEKTIISTLNTVSSTPADQLPGLLLDHLLQFGLKVLAAIVIYIIGGWIVKLIRKSLRNVFTSRNTDTAIVSFTMSLVTAVLWVVIIILTIGALGVETTSLAALLAAGGMAIGMAMSGTVQNFAGGVMLLIFKPFKAGDFIEAQGYSGTVTEVNITTTKLLTTDNKVVVLPNSLLQSGTVNNYSQMEFRRIDFTIDVEYGSDAEVVKSTLLGIAASDERIITAEGGAPADPFASIILLAESSVQFTFRIWVRSADYWPVFFDTNERIYRELPAHGIQFPFPQLSVHMEN